MLQGDVTHPTAESVFAVARAEMETISLKTVYQTLNELAALGEIAALDLGTGTTRFDPNVEASTIISSAGRAARCVTSTSTSPRLGALGADEGFEVGEAEVVFRGRCQQCRHRVVRPGTAPRRRRRVATG